MADCTALRIPRYGTGKRLSLRLTRLRCDDETEHEGFWPFEGEGVANDAMRLIVTSTSAWKDSVEAKQCTSDLLDLGSNYEDGTTVVLNREVAAYYLPDSARFPFVANIILLLVEEDWGGMNWDAGVQDVIDVTGSTAAKVVSSAASGATAGAIAGTALGPLGTAIGGAVGAVVGWITGEIAKAIGTTESDVFDPTDLSLSLASVAARFDSANPNRLERSLKFKSKSIGGEYTLFYEWRLDAIRPLTRPQNGMSFLFRWYNHERKDNFLTSDPNWESRVGDREAGYHLSRIEGQAFDPRGAQPEGTIPLFRWWSGDRTDNFTTSDPSWGIPMSRVRWRPGSEKLDVAVTRSGYNLSRLEGFIYDPKRPQPPGTRPLFSWWNPDRRDNFCTTQQSWSMPPDRVQWRGEQIVNGPTRDGYRCYRLEGYVR